MNAFTALLVTVLAVYLATSVVGFVILWRQVRRMKREQNRTVILSRGEKTLLLALLAATVVLYLILLAAACVTAGEKWMGEMKRFGLYGLIAVFFPHYGFGLWTAAGLLYLDHKRNQNKPV